MAYAIDSRPVRAWEIMRLTAWTFVLTARSATDAFDRPSSDR
ncbi:MAG TPA: hypothetical protein VK059_05380 [Nocardioidaceae bacterium]|nr:hypothetical protein [Nocardioidaceae bacterium]